MIGYNLCPSNPWAQGHHCRCIGQQLSFLYDFLSVPGVNAETRVWQAWREHWLRWRRKYILPVTYGRRSKELGASRRRAYKGEKLLGDCICNFRCLSVWRQKYIPCPNRLLLYYSGLLLEKNFTSILKNIVLNLGFEEERQSSLVSQFQSDTTL